MSDTDNNNSDSSNSTNSDGEIVKNGADSGKTHESIVPIDIQAEVGQSFLDYAMSVIVSRALPDARDGLKPVHRRILWSMYSTGLRPNRGHVKCATVVGDVIGKYHPHGDSAVYDAMVRMGQTFSLRHTLIDPHGNFGSPGDRAAAYRYTECRLTELAMAMLNGANEDTVDFNPNFDGRHQEPRVLPSRFPNLLVNGSQGIAVGLATNIPPHNLAEVIEAAIHLLKNPEATYEDLHEIVLAPDFPTGGCILGTRNTQLAYETGRGQIKLRGVGEISEDGSQIVFTEFPYQVSAEAIEERVHDLVSNKTLQGIKDVRNESAKGKTRLVFELNNAVNAAVVLNNLYKRTPLQVTFAANMVALDKDVPLTMNLRDLLWAYVEHQKDVIRRRTQYRLEQNLARAHILEGLIKALDAIDQVIAAIKGADDRGAAREALMSAPFEFSEIQANHILDMPLGRLTRLGHSELSRELEECRVNIAALEAILADENKLANVIIEEMNEIKEKHAEPRRTQILDDPGEILLEDLIEDEELIFMLSKGGYVKCVLAEDFKAQNRGGMGVTGSKLIEKDHVTFLLKTTAHSDLLFFTNKGKVYRIKAYEVPRMGRTARGRALINILAMQPDEETASILQTNGDYSTHPFLLFATKKGKVKKTKFEKYEQVRKSGLKAVNLVEGDELIQVLPIHDGSNIGLISRFGRMTRFSGDQIRPTGRGTAGVRGMRFKDVKNDGVVAVVQVMPQTKLLVITEKGYGKQTRFEDFNMKGRGGLGVVAAKYTEAKGRVASAIGVKETDEVMMMAQSGKLIRIPVENISTQGRAATGIRVMRLTDDDTLTSIALVDELNAGMEATEAELGPETEPETETGIEPETELETKDESK